MSIECPICYNVFDIGDPTDLAVDEETVDVIELIKKREALSK